MNDLVSLFEDKIKSIPIPDPIPVPVIGEISIEKYIQSESGLITSTENNINNIKNYYIDQFNKYISENNPTGTINNVSYKFNTLLSPVTPSTTYYSDIICQSAINTQPPEKIDYRTYLKEPRDQGKHGTCVAFTTSAVVEFYLNLYGEYKNYVSPRFIYAHRNSNSSGMTMNTGLSIIKSYGSIPEDELPYSNFNESEKNNIITPKMKIDAQKYIKINSQSMIRSVNDLKVALANNGPCTMALPVFLDADEYTILPNFWKKGTGRSDPPRSVFFHAVSVIGYDNTSFLIRNSWGTNTGNGGYFNLPFTDWGCVCECYTVLPIKPLPADIIYVYNPENKQSWNKNWLYFLLIIPIGGFIFLIYDINQHKINLKKLVNEGVN